MMTKEEFLKKIPNFDWDTNNCKNHKDINCKICPFSMHNWAMEKDILACYERIKYYINLKNNLKKWENL